MPFRVPVLALLVLALVPSHGGAATPKRDLAAGRLSAPATVTPGAATPVALRVRRAGGAPARVTVRLLLSTDAKVDRRDVRMGKDRALRFRKGARSALLKATLRLPASVAQRRTLLACVDPAAKLKERSEKNNCARARLVLARPPAAAPQAPAPAAPPAPVAPPEPVDPFADPPFVDPARTQLSGADPTAMLPLATQPRIAIPEGIDADPLTHVVELNGTEVPQAKLAQDATGITYTGGLVSGRNELVANLLASDGTRAEHRVVLWAGSLPFVVTVRDGGGAAIPGAAVRLQLGDDEAVALTGQTGPDGKAAFAGVPDRTVIVTATEGDRFSSTATTGNAGAATLTLEPLGEPSPVANDDLSLGTTEGWVGVGATPEIVDHVDEGGTAAAKRAGGPCPPDCGGRHDIRIVTGGEGPVRLMRTLRTRPDTRSVSVRYRFTTSEIPGGYFGTRYNDSYAVSLSGGGGHAEANTMNGLGRSAFDNAGSTGWRRVSLPVGGDQVVRLDATVANVGDGALDSHVTVDAVEQSKIKINGVKLRDTDGSELKSLSLTPHSAFDGNTLVHGTIDVSGPDDDEIADVQLELVTGNRIVARGSLSTLAEPHVKQAFGDDGHLRFVGGRLFKFENHALTGVDQTTDETLVPRVVVTSKDGDRAEAVLPTVVKLVDYKGGNRFGVRDLDVGGDGWVQPGVAKVADALSLPELTYNDFSNMNGGVFPPHDGHRDGGEFDATFPSYGARGTAAAEGLLALLRGPSGSRIRVIYAAYRRGPGSDFWRALDGETVHGRPADRVIVSDSEHTTHFHVTVRGG